MKNLHVTVRDKVATYSERDGKIVCGNTDYQIVFAFDEDWAEYDEKTAVFIFEDTAREVKFRGNICKVPIVRNSTVCTVGVYVGELSTTTPAYIPCNKSIRCEMESVTEVLDISATTATEEDVLYGEIFYKADGTPAVGAIMIGDILPEVNHNDNGKILRVVGGAWEASTDIPIFDLTALGLPAIPKSGEVVTVAADTTEIVAGLASGSVFFTLQIAEDDTPATHKLLMNPDESSAGLYGCSFPMTSTEILTVIVMPNSIMAFWSNIEDRILPAVTSADNGKVAGVVDGKWVTVTPEVSGSGSGGVSGPVSWNDITDKPFGVLEDGTIVQMDNSFLEPLETVAKETDIFPAATVEGFALDETYGAYTPGFSSAGSLTLSELETYNVVWDGVFYTCNSFTFEVEGDTFVGLGNGAYVGQTGNDEPFLIAYTPAYGMKQFFANTTETSHTVRVYQTVPAYQLREDYLPMDAIKTYIDDYINEALGGDY